VSDCAGVGGMYCPVRPPLRCTAPHFPLAPSPSFSLDYLHRLRPQDPRAVPAYPSCREPEVSFGPSAAAAVFSWPGFAVGLVEVGSVHCFLLFFPFRSRAL
jgi:hypothetical protein